MKVTFRMVCSIFLIVAPMVMVFAVLQARRERKQFLDDLRRRQAILIESVENDLGQIIAEGNSYDLGQLLERSRSMRRFLRVAVFDTSGETLAAPREIEPPARWLPTDLKHIMASGHPTSTLHRLPDDRLVDIYIAPIRGPDGPVGSILLMEDVTRSFVGLRTVWEQTIGNLLVYGFLISLGTLMVIRWNIMGPLQRAADWIKDLRLGKHPTPLVPLPKDIFLPLAKEVSQMAKSLSSARAAAEEEAALRQSAASLWTAERLKELVRIKLRNKALYVVSNREPYMHVKRGKEIRHVIPPSGLVTALEPILRACGGTWIAHGSGDADRAVVDEFDKIQVPPEEPQYTLRRVWLSEKEEAGYYFGFSNEGLWPLCHIAHARPLFRPEDWESYQQVNRKFADVLLEEIRGVDEPLVLIQDYHYALLPRLVKEKRPDARVAVFWHIPWPNPESFGVCPWGRELLDGLLGADLLGFHIQYHCNNFLETVDRVLESRTDWERFAVNRQGHTTWVKPFPISVAFTGRSVTGVGPPTISAEVLLRNLGIKAKYLGVGVDRIDYTKGIVERFQGIERFLEKNPDFRGAFTFVELAAPSRERIDRYHDLIEEVESEALRINALFETRDWKPIVLLVKQHSHKDIEPYYKAADICLVTSLHDGMNLVAKEYIAAQERENGVLILSRFTGAARELRDALIVNPYDVDRLAEAIRVGLLMEPAERAVRMHRLRETVRENNIYRWAAQLVSELASLPLPRLEKIGV